MKKLIVLLAFVLVYITISAVSAEVLSPDEKDMSIAQRTKIRLLIENLANHREAQLKAMETLVELGDTAVPMLLRYLKNETVEIRAYVAVTLGKIGTTDAIEPIANLLGDKSFFVATKAQDALRELAHVNEDAAIADVTEVLKGKLSNGNNEIRSLAVEVLIDLKPLELADTLLDLLGDSHWKVKADAAKALGGISADTTDEQREKICNALLPLFNDRDWRVARSAAVSGGFYLNLTNMFIKTVEDEEGKFTGYEVSNLRPIAYKIIDAEIALLSNQSEAVKSAAAIALGKVWILKAEEKAEAINNALIAALDDAADEVRVSVATAIARVGSKEAVGAIIAHLEAEKVPIVLNMYVEALRARTLVNQGFQPYDLLEETEDNPIDTPEKYEEAKKNLEEKREEAIRKWIDWWEENKDSFEINPTIK